MALHIKIPENIGDLLSNDLDQALSERKRVRDEMTTAFDKGYWISGFNSAINAYELSGCHTQTGLSHS